MAWNAHPDIEVVDVHTCQGLQGCTGDLASPPFKALVVYEHAVRTIAFEDDKFFYTCRPQVDTLIRADLLKSPGYQNLKHLMLHRITNPGKGQDL